MKHLLPGLHYASVGAALVYAFTAVAAQDLRYMVGANFIAAGSLLLQIAHNRLTSD